MENRKSERGSILCKFSHINFWAAHASKILTLGGIIPACINLKGILIFSLPRTLLRILN